MNMRTRFIVVGVLFAVFAAFVHTHANMAVPMNRPFMEFPIVVGDWRMTNQSIFSDAVLKSLKPSDYLAREYTSADGTRAYLYIGYHDGGPGGGGIHSPKHCLPGSGWFRISEVTETVDLGARKVRLVRTVYEKGSQKELFLYWFQMRDKTITSEYELKVQEMMNSVFHRRKDESFIRLSVRFDADEQKAYAQGILFLKTFDPLISGFLPK
ncbi:MAG: hypothetical protein FD164_1744 [Nitrospirae bacterium]|nr:MAG: hypothetical protein FD164_1744 [Nitrospirota bacterium]